MIYAISDTHGELPEVPADAHLLLFGGDICPDYGTSADQRQRHWLDTEFRDYIEPIAERGVEIVATWGNHDFVGEMSFLWPDLPWSMLVDREHVTRDGLRVWGTPWVPGLPRWAFFADNRALKMRADLIPEGLDILITHGPPRFYGDYIPTSERQRNKYGNYGGDHVGDISISEAIHRAQPQIVICGHIHEARGGYMLPGRDDFVYHRVENCAAVDAVYDLVPDPWVPIELGAAPHPAAAS